MVFAVVVVAACACLVVWGRCSWRCQLTRLRCSSSKCCVCDVWHVCHSDCVFVETCLLQVLLLTSTLLLR